MLRQFWYWFENTGVPGNHWTKGLLYPQSCEGEESVVRSIRVGEGRNVQGCDRLVLCLRLWQAKKAPTTKGRTSFKLKNSLSLCKTDQSVGWLVSEKETKAVHWRIHQSVKVVVEHVTLAADVPSSTFSKYSLRLTFFNYNMGLTIVSMT